MSTFSQAEWPLSSSWRESAIWHCFSTISPWSVFQISTRQSICTLHRVTDRHRTPSPTRRNCLTRCAAISGGQSTQGWWRAYLAACPRNLCLCSRSLQHAQHANLRGSTGQTRSGIGKWWHRDDSMGRSLQSIGATPQTGRIRAQAPDRNASGHYGRARLAPHTCGSGCGQATRR